MAGRHGAVALAEILHLTHKLEAEKWEQRERETEKRTQEEWPDMDF